MNYNLLLFLSAIDITHCYLQTLSQNNKKIKKIMKQNKIREELKNKLFQNNQRTFISLNQNQLPQLETISKDQPQLGADKSESFHRNYVLLHELGQGCHASVYKAVHKESKKYYAVKVEQTGDPEILHNHIRTFKNCQKLHHPNLLSYYEMYIDENKEKVYNVMEYSAYETLEKQLHTFSSSEFRMIFLQIVSTLDFCHKKSICHRDIKPDNILVNKSENGIDVKIIDFDVSKDFKLRDMWTCVGCVYYCAPEMFSGCGYTHLIDLWSVGVLFYQFLVRKLPFYKETVSETIESILYEEIDIPSDVIITPLEKDLLRRLLNKDPDNRISADEALRHPYFYEDLTSETKSDNGFSFDEISQLSQLQDQQSYSSKQIDIEECIQQLNAQKIHITKKPFYDLSKVKLLKFRDASFTPNPQLALKQ